MNSVRVLKKELAVSTSVAKELAILGGDDIELVIECSRASDTLSECKARIIDRRFREREEEQC